MLRVTFGYFSFYYVVMLILSECDFFYNLKSAELSSSSVNGISGGEA